jgi:hypothetical protein
LKTLVFLLVFVNLLFYAFSGGYFGKSGNPDAGRSEQQLAAERVRIVARGDQPPPKAGNGADKPAAESASPRSAEPEEMCLSWERLPATDADRLASTLAEKFAGVRVERRAVASEGSGWWVFVPPQASRADADKKASELKELGIKDFFIIQEGPNRFAVSLGVLSTEKGGQELLAELKSKGVKSAKVGPRPGKESHFSVQARGPLARQADVQDLAAGIVPKVSPQACK